VDLVRIILNVKGLDLYKRDDKCWTAIHWASLIGNKEILTLLLKYHDVSINHTNDVSCVSSCFLCLII
jgi:ankyrin repeat protein